MRGVLLVVVVASSLIVATAGDAPRRVQYGGALDPTGAVRIYMLAGRVEVRTWDRDSVHVTATLGRNARVHAGGTRSAYKLATYEGTPDSIPVATLAVRVPRRAQLWIKTSSAPVTAHGVMGSVELHTIEGSIDASGNPRDLRVESMRGSVTLAGDPAWLRVRTGTGAITVTGSVGDLALSTVSGDVTTPAGATRGRVETIRGAVVITRLPPRGASLDVDTHTGPVTVVAAGAPNAVFSVFSATGQITNGLSAARPRRRDGAGRELRFTAGGGGAQVAIRTFDGGVSLRR